MIFQFRAMLTVDKFTLQKKRYIFGIVKKSKIEFYSTFIRAPKINDIGNDINIIAKQEDLPVAIMSKNLLGLSFHPEIDGIDIFHKMMFDKSSKFYFEKLKQGYAA